MGNAAVKAFGGVLGNSGEKRRRRAFARTMQHLQSPDKGVREAAGAAIGEFSKRGASKASPSPRGATKNSQKPETPEAPVMNDPAVLQAAAAAVARFVPRLEGPRGGDLTPEESEEEDDAVSVISDHSHASSRRSRRSVQGEKPRLPNTLLRPSPPSLKGSDSSQPGSARGKPASSRGSQQGSSIRKAVRGRPTVAIPRLPGEYGGSQPSKGSARSARSSASQNSGEGASKRPADLGPIEEADEEEEEKEEVWSESSTDEDDEDGDDDAASNKPGTSQTQRSGARSSVSGGSLTQSSKGF